MLTVSLQLFNCRLCLNSLIAHFIRLFQKAFILWYLRGEYTNFSEGIANVLRQWWLNSIRWLSCLYCCEFIKRNNTVQSFRFFNLYVAMFMYAWRIYHNKDSEREIRVLNYSYIYIYSIRKCLKFFCLHNYEFYNLVF